MERIPSKQSYHSGTQKKLHSCIDCHFFVPAQCGCCVIRKHKDEWSLSPYIIETSSAQKRECSKILSDTFQPQFAVQQEASGITRQNVASLSAGPRSNLNPQSLLQNQFFFLGTAAPKLHPTYSHWNNEH